MVVAIPILSEGRKTNDLVDSIRISKSSYVLFFDSFAEDILSEPIDDGVDLLVSLKAYIVSHEFFDFHAWVF